MIFPIVSLIGLVAARSIPREAASARVSQLDTTGFQNAVTAPSRGGQAVCVSGNVAVTASARNVKLNFESPANQTQAVETFISFISDGSPFTQTLFAGVQEVSGTYDIGVSLCMPVNGTQSSTVQFLTHGVGFDRYYWDFAPGYSYVDVAAEQGYPTFIYDRLGTGNSTKADPITEVQAPLQVAIAGELIGMLRNGQFGGMNFTNVVGAGHSYGSIITQAVTSQLPELLDATVLTGYSVNGSGLSNFLIGNNFGIASLNAPDRFGDLSNGYVVSATAISNQIAFFKAPGFDPEILALTEATKQPATYGEFFSQMAVTKPATNYTSPVAIVNGDADLPFCDGNCTYPVNKAAQAKAALYPRAANTTNSIYIAADTGHGLNLHYSATQAFEYIQEFIRNNGF